MKKYIITLSVLLWVTKTNAQIIIGSNSNQQVSSSSVLVEFGSQPKGLLLPWVTNTTSVNGAVAGTMIYDLSDKKVKYLVGGAGVNAGWNDLSIDASGAATSTLQDALTDNINARTIIGDPAATAPGILVLDSPSKAMVLPKVQTAYNNIITPSPGMMVYDSTNKQFAVFNGTVWTFHNAGPTVVTTVTTPTNRVWMDRNLGASQIASSSSDTSSYGHLYQWGRLTDGHQSRTSASTTTLSATDTPGNGNFIISSAAPNDWRSGQNSLLWQGTGLTGINNPCPSRFRLPTIAEFQAEFVAANITNSASAYNSALKLPAAGNRLNTGVISNPNVGYYWTSSISGTNSQIVQFDGSSVNITTAILARANGASVRCIRE